MRIVVFMFVLLAALYPDSANADLMMGDFSFVGFNADGDDGFAIVALTDIAAGEEVLFRDEEWDGVSAFAGTGEGEFLWTTSALTAGSVVTFVTDAGAPSTVSSGTVTASGMFAGDMGISSGGETIYAFVGSSNTPTSFIAGISTDAGEDISGTGLTAGSTFTVLPDGIDVAEYNGVRTGQSVFSDYLPLIGDTGSNWNIVTGGGGDQSGDILPFNTTSFSVVPEPGTVGILFASSLFFLGRRKK